MPYYLSFDGGGTKSCAILFDEEGPLRYGRSGGTNTTSAPIEDCRCNIAECLEQTLQGYEGAQLEALYVNIVGPVGVLLEELQRRASLQRTVMLGEAQAGVLAGALTYYGLVAQAGTGSDAFYCSPQGGTTSVGAAGPILGDDGSGAWVGQQAMRKAIAYADGWGEPTSFLSLLLERWELPHKNALIDAVYRHPAPFRKVASCVPIVAEAARMGDKVSLGLFHEAAELMALQMLALMRQKELMDTPQMCVCCGGCWKAHPAMYERFVAILEKEAPLLVVQKPIFEHVMAGVIAQQLETDASLTPEALCERLSGPYAAYRIQW